MKYLLVLIVVMVGIWVWRSNRADARSESRSQSRRREAARDAAAVDMVGCDLCGLHCPRDDLVSGRKGVYCSTGHRNQAET